MALEYKDILGYLYDAFQHFKARQPQLSLIL